MQHIYFDVSIIVQWIVETSSIETNALILVLFNYISISRTNRNYYNCYYYSRDIRDLTFIIGGQDSEAPCNKYNKQYGLISSYCFTLATLKQTHDVQVQGT